jgi:DNA-binding response OmpR family regulator
MNHTVLVVEDDLKTAELLRMYLEKEGYRVFTAADGPAALSLTRERNPDLVLLDLMLPVLDGLDICRVLRAESDVPIIMLTAKSTEDDTLLGLRLGADDYITKPFSPREVVARVHTVLRRMGQRQQSGPRQAQFGELLIDFERHEVILRGVPLRLTPKEFKLLETLSRQPGKVFSRAELLEKVFGYDYEGLDRTVDVHMMNLRKKIERDPAQPVFLQTVYGVGYKFAGGDHAP